MKINILLADGRKLLREALALLLEKHDDLRVVGEAEDGHDAVRLVNPTPATQSVPDLVRSIIKARPGIRVSTDVQPGG